MDYTIGYISKFVSPFWLHLGLKCWASPFIALITNHNRILNFSAGIFDTSDLRITRGLFSSTFSKSKHYISLQSSYFIIILFHCNHSCPDHVAEAPLVVDMNTAWDGLEETSDLNGHILFMQEDHHIFPNAYQNTQLFVGLKPNKCPKCYAINLAPSNVKEGKVGRA